MSLRSGTCIPVGVAFNFLEDLIGRHPRSAEVLDFICYFFGHFHISIFPPFDCFVEILADV